MKSDGLHNSDSLHNKGMVIWLTGLSASGKTTLAREILDRLKSSHIETELLDGDEIRSHFPQTGFSKEERHTHIKRVGYLASLLEKHRVFVVAALISPYRESRQAARALCQHFVEVYVSTPLDVCEQRDPKGLYQKARRGELAHFTGIDDPYEAPESPEIIVDLSSISVETAAQRVIDYCLNS